MSCRAGGERSCYNRSKNPPNYPPLTKECGLCPPCPAKCNPEAPPTPAEREAARLTVAVKNLEEDYKTKVTECAMLRTDIMKRREELEKEIAVRKELESKVRHLEMKLEGLSTATNKLLGTKEQLFEQEMNMKTLKQCYREAKEEINELRQLAKDQDEQIQDYRVKFMNAQQLVEEQRRQMDMMDLDNERISEQINLEIQRVKLKFQEKLQELAPLPDILKNTQAKLKDAQNGQMLAEHNAESLARELHTCREKIHVMMTAMNNAKEKPQEKSTGTEAHQMMLLHTKITTLQETNTLLRNEQERLKANIIRLEQNQIETDKHLQDKMHECAQLGGELDRAREEASRAISRATERTDTVRRCLQGHVAELERQLANSRAQVTTIEKEREELRRRLQCQLDVLNESFDMAQSRIRNLEGQVFSLRQTADGEGDVEPCACRELFQ